VTVNTCYDLSLAKVSGIVTVSPFSDCASLWDPFYPEERSQLQIAHTVSSKLN